MVNKNDDVGPKETLVPFTNSHGSDCRVCAALEKYRLLRSVGVGDLQTARFVYNPILDLVDYRA